MSRYFPCTNKAFLKVRVCSLLLANHNYVVGIHGVGHTILFQEAICLCSLQTSGWENIVQPKLLETAEIHAYQ